jgi:hypothetical protein
MTQEWGEGKGEEALTSENPLSPTLAPLVPRGAMAVGVSLSARFRRGVSKILSPANVSCYLPDSL